LGSEISLFGFDIELGFQRVKITQFNKKGRLGLRELKSLGSTQWITRFPRLPAPTDTPRLMLLPSERFLL